MQYRVYVIELRDGSLYVGSTAHAIQHRYEQHRQGGKLAARVCKRVGVRRLRPCFYRNVAESSSRQRQWMVANVRKVVKSVA